MIDSNNFQRIGARFDLGSENPPGPGRMQIAYVDTRRQYAEREDDSFGTRRCIFHVALELYRKIFFVLKHFRKEQSLAAYYLKTHGHLVPPGVELWEYDLESSSAERLC
jgi:hypothetical protein